MFLFSAYVRYVLIPEDLNSRIQLNNGKLADALPGPRDCKREQPVWSSVISSLRLFPGPSAKAVKIDQRACMGAPTDFVDPVVGDNVPGQPFPVDRQHLCPDRYRQTGWRWRIVADADPNSVTSLAGFEVRCKALVHAHSISATNESRGKNLGNVSKLLGLAKKVSDSFRTWDNVCVNEFRPNLKSRFLGLSSPCSVARRDRSGT